MLRVDFGTPGGGWICLSVTGGVPVQTFVEIEEKVFPLFFSQSLPNLLFHESDGKREAEVSDGQEGWLDKSV